jgi:hypothetical protein
MDGAIGEGEDFTGVPLVRVSARDPRIVRLGAAPGGRPVWLSIHDVDPDAGRPMGFAPEPPTLRIRASGLRLEPTMPADLHAWVRLRTGQWRAIVTAELHSPNSRTRLRAPFWCPPDAITPREPDLDVVEAILRSNETRPRGISG